jgi:hypothetical protein
MAEISKACPRNKTHVAGSNHRNAHEVSISPRLSRNLPG